MAAAATIVKLYDQPLGVGFGTARLYAYATLVTGAVSGQENGVTVTYGVALDGNASTPPTSFVPLPAADFMNTRLMRGLP